jgi:hypothetical protein
VKKGYFGKSSTTTLKVGGGSSGMLKTKVGGDDGSSTARPISMSTIMKGGESSQKIIQDGRLDSQSMGFQSMSKPKPKGGTFLPDLFQPTKKQQEQQQQEQQQTFKYNVRDVPTTITTPAEEEEVADINKQEQLAQKLQWLQKTPNSVMSPQQQQQPPGLETLRQRQQQLQQQPQQQQPLRLDPTSLRQQQQGGMLVGLVLLHV